MNFKSTIEFQKDFKRLSKKFRSLDEDLVEFKKVLYEAPLGIGKHFKVIAKIENARIVKARFFSKSLKKKDLRIIYAYLENQQTIEMVGLILLKYISRVRKRMKTARGLKIIRKVLTRAFSIDIIYDNCQYLSFLHL